jgi:hypothetical protein
MLLNVIPVALAVVPLFFVMTCTTTGPSASPSALDVTPALSRRLFQFCTPNSLLPVRRVCVLLGNRIYKYDNTFAEDVVAHITGYKNPYPRTRT